MVLNFIEHNFLAVFGSLNLAIVLAFLCYPYFDHDTDLPHHCAHLHWTYNPAETTLSVSFIAPPPARTGWVAWGINPTGSGMVGAQAIVLSLDSHGSFAMGKYNLSSYQAIAESKSFWADVVQLKAVYSLGLMRFEAKLALPEKRETINHVWQIGRLSTSAKLNVHDMLESNLKSFGVLNLTKAKKSFFLRFVDGLSLVLLFEKGCTLGGKSIWNEYFTLHNIGVACFYCAMLKIVVLSAKAQNKKYGAYWTLFHDGVSVTCWIIYLIMMIKLLGFSVIQKRNFVSTYWKVFIAALGLLVALLVYLSKKKAALLVAFHRIDERTAKISMKQQLKFLASCRRSRFTDSHQD